MKDHTDAVIELGVGEIKITKAGKDSYYVDKQGVKVPLKRSNFY